MSTQSHGHWQGKLNHIRAGEPPCPDCATVTNPYAGQPHGICAATADIDAAHFTAALADAERRHDADVILAAHIRWLCLPGQSRRTVRVAELRAALMTADRRAGVKPA